MVQGEGTLRLEATTSALRLGEIETAVDACA